jgi:hypothetical protein
LQTSSRRQKSEWDLRKLCDHLHTTYSASFEGWNEFIALNAEPPVNGSSVNGPLVHYIPDFLGDFKFDWKPDTQEVSVESGTVSVNAGKDVFEWNGLSELFITLCWYQTEGSQENETAEQSPIEFGVRRINLYRDPRHREFTNLHKNIKPDPRLGSIAAEGWNDFVLAKYPFDEKSHISANGNTGSVGTIFKAETPIPGVLYSLYLSMEDPQDEENLGKRFSTLKAGVRVTK